MSAPSPLAVLCVAIVVKLTPSSRPLDDDRPCRRDAADALHLNGELREDLVARCRDDVAAAVLGELLVVPLLHGWAP
jgi:hypothetical protein